MRSLVELIRHLRVGIAPVAIAGLLTLLAAALRPPERILDVPAGGWSSAAAPGCDDPTSGEPRTFVLAAPHLPGGLPPAARPDHAPVAAAAEVPGREAASTPFTARDSGPYPAPLFTPAAYPNSPRSPPAAI